MKANAVGRLGQTKQGGFPRETYHGVWHQRVSRQLKGIGKQRAIVEKEKTQVTWDKGNGGRRLFLFSSLITLGVGTSAGSDVLGKNVK